jgi:hypothetical protein
MRFYLLLCSFFSVFLLNAQPGDAPANTQSGKCYAKCIVKKYQKNPRDAYSIPVFTGKDPEGILLDTIVFDVKPTNSKCIKRKILSETEISYYTVYVVDTLQTDDYIWENFDDKNKQIIGTTTEWREVLCGEKVTDKLIERLAAALITKGYNMKKWKGGNTLTPELKETISQYQKDNELPLGNLNIETLDSLGLF